MLKSDIHVKSDIYLLFIKIPHSVLLNRGSTFLNHEQQRKYTTDIIFYACKNSTVMIETAVSNVSEMFVFLLPFFFLNIINVT